jgi:hypothetical protein
MADSSHPHELLAGISSRYPGEELRARLLEIDLVASDIDECLFPGFSQSYLGHQIFYDIMTRPETITDLRFVPQLVHGGAFIRKVKLLRRVGRPPENAVLMRRYEHSMWLVPQAYFLKGAQRIPGRSFRGVAETLALLGRRAPVGLISFGIQLIADEYMRQLNDAAARPFVVFAEANPVVFEPGSDGRPAFKGYDPAPRTEPRHKREILEQRLQLHQASRPLILGNGRDECEMAVLAAERAGLSVGFQPEPRDAQCFDVVLRTRDWLPLVGLLRQVLGQDPNPGATSGRLGPPST